MTEQSHSPTGDDELRHKFAAFVSHATGGRTSDISLPLNTLSVMASQKVNDAWQAALEKGRAESHVAHSPTEATGDDVEILRLNLFYQQKIAERNEHFALAELLEKAIATLSPNGVSQSAVERAERDIEAAMICLAKRAEEVGTHPPSWKELAKEAARAALATQPEREAADKLEAMQAVVDFVLMTIDRDDLSDGMKLIAIRRAALNLNRERG